MTTSVTEQEWRESESGLPPGRLPIQVINAEHSGVTEPILIAASAPGGPKPIAAQIELAAQRAERWVRLRTKTNPEKKVALVYFNNPAGKATLGASYLDLIPSLHNVVTRLGREGYRVDGRVPDEERLKKLLLMSGRNVGEYAPGELRALVEEGHAALLPVARYEEWFRQLPEAFQREVTRVWGSPRQSKLMTVHPEGKTFFVIPGIRLGNLFLLPQPLRGDVARPTRGRMIARLRRPIPISPLISGSNISSTPTRSCTSDVMARSNGCRERTSRNRKATRDRF
jgi:cobaltochelatase CobN